MDIEYARPLSGRKKEEVTAFLKTAGIRFDEGAQFTVILRDEDEIVAAGSLDGSIIKCVATAPEHQGEGLFAKVLTELYNEAFRCGVSHLFLYTKPSNRALFESLGFSAVASTPDTLLMENRRNGVDRFIEALPKPENAENVGCIVANCNPFTLGHSYLMHSAAAQCSFLYVFILSEDRAMFPPEVRLRLAREGTADIKNITVQPSGGYLVSSATFPTYFLKQNADLNNVKCALDIAVFTERFVPKLHIKKRFVGTEPLSPVTEAYNRALIQALPRAGVEVIELQRTEADGLPVSASRVRELLLSGKAELTRPLVPDTTYDYLMKTEG